MTPMDRMMRNRIVVESAGTENFPHVVKPMLSDYPRSRELDVYHTGVID